MNARTEQDLDDELSQLAKPPWSQEAEQSVLGALLLDNSAWDRVGDVLRDTDFFSQQHRLIFAALGSLINALKGADVITVFLHLQAQHKDTECGGMAYLNSLASSVPSAANIRRYAEIVRGESLRRKLIAAAADVQAMGYDTAGSAADAIDRAAMLFSDLQQGTVRHEPKDAGSLIVRQVDHWNALRLREVPAGIPTGIATLDEALNGGLREGKVYVLAARPSVGKSSLAQAIALHVTIEQRHAALILSQEMEASECMDRAAANLGCVDYEHLQTGGLTDAEWGGASMAVEMIGKAPLFIDDQAALTLEQIRGKAVSLRREGLKLLVLDYLQLCDYAAERGQSTADALGRLSKGLKRLAKDLKLAVVVLSQLNREVEKRGSPEPYLSDLRDSGAIEQDADVVAMLWRVRQWSDRSIMGLSLPKNRQGKAGRRIALEFFGQYQRWAESDADINPPNRTESKGSFE